MSSNSLAVSNNNEVFQATVGDGGEIRLPVPGGFASLGLRPGSTVYVSLSPPFIGNGAYPASAQGPIIIVTGDQRKAEEKKDEKPRSEVYKRL